MPFLLALFGGQRYQNLSNVFCDEIYEWCNKLNLRICLDISYSVLKFVNVHLKLKSSKFLETVAPVTAHLHVADAEGTNGEGLQNCEGSIDLERFYRYYTTNFLIAPSATWRSGKVTKTAVLDFWTALECLSGRI